MLKSAESFPAHKCETANNCWNFNINEQENSILGFACFYYLYFIWLFDLLLGYY